MGDIQSHKTQIYKRQMVKAVKILTWPITQVITTEEDQDQDKYRQQKSINLQTGTSCSKSVFYFETFFIFRI